VAVVVVQVLLETDLVLLEQQVVQVGLAVVLAVVVTQAALTAQEFFIFSTRMEQL
jgi:hypothetical protein